jgi:hypothetical protein
MPRFFYYVWMDSIIKYEYESVNRYIKSNTRWEYNERDMSLE